MDNEIMSKLWGLVSVALTSLLGYFMYNVKKNQDNIQTLSDAQHALKSEHRHLEGALQGLKEDLEEIKRALQSDTKELKRLLFRLARQSKTKL